MLNQTVSFMDGDQKFIGIIMDKVSLPCRVAINQEETTMLVVDHYLIVDAQAQSHFVVCNQVSLAKKASIKTPTPMDINRLNGN